jgi:hypothetical protein
MLRWTLGLCVLGVAAGAAWPHAGADDDEAAVRGALEHYLEGHATGEAAHMAAAFHRDAMLFWVQDGELRQRSSADYIAGFTGHPAADEARRRRWIERVDIAGTAASGKIVLDYPSGRFVDYMSLLKVDGEWKIVNKIFHREPVRD